MRPPSGAQHTLVHGDQRAVVVEVGGGLRSLQVGDRQVLDGYPESAMADAGRGQLLVPWPNRVEDGRYSFGGRDLQLAINEVGAATAIHGLVRWASWRPVEQDDHRVVLEHVLNAQPGYPFRLRLRVAYELGDGLTVTMTAQNDGDEAAPYGFGAHPYVLAGAGGVDDLLLTSPASTVLHSDERGIPRTREAVDGTPYDFRDGRRIGDLVLDHGFTDLARDDEGTARVVVADPSSGTETELWTDASIGHLMVFSGDTLPPERRRRGLAVEPMTCPPNAFRTGESLISLDPGATTTSTWGIRPRGDQR